MEKREGYSKTQEQFGFELAFNHINFLIERKKHLTKNSRVYIQWAKDYLQSATKSLDSMIDNEKYESYHFTPYLAELIESVGKKKEGFSKNDALEVKDKLSSLMVNLDNLKKNPYKFYSTNASKETSDFFKKFLPNSEIKLRSIMTCYESMGWKDISGND